MRNRNPIASILLIVVLSVFAKNSDRTARVEATTAVPTINLHQITGASKKHQFKYKDWSLWIQEAKAIKSFDERRKLLNNPDYILSYIVFWLDDIVQNKNKYKAGTVSLCLSQSYKESAFGLSTLGLKGNHFGIKGKFDLNASQTQHAKDDHPWKSTFGVSKNFGYAGLVQYFRTISNKRFDNPKRVRGNRENYKTWTHALQCGFKYHKQCNGLGCNECHGLGIKGSVYATMKEELRIKADPSRYTKALDSIIKQYKWDSFDGLSLNEIKAWQRMILERYTGKSENRSVVSTTLN